MICCIDSNTFIWGIKKKATSGQEDMIPRAEYLFEWLHDNKHQILIPTVVIAEVLAPEPLEKYPILMDIINRGFMIADFDVRAASRYGQLFMNKLKESKKIAKQNSISTQKMKIDHLIISCALIHNAACIYSTDTGLRAFGQKFIDVRDLPPLPPPKLIQTKIWSETETGLSIEKNEDLEEVPF